ncbi:MAG: alpha/beta hydrolase [Alphaproteobacteria bacterium]
MPDLRVAGRTVHVVAPRDFQKPQGHVILLVHGAYDDHRYWQHLIDPLARAHTPIAVDLPGRGGSEGPPLDSAIGYRRFFAALVETLALPPFVFFGHSMGGSMAVDFAIHHGQRVKAIIPLSSAPRWSISDDEIASWDGDTDKAYRDNLPFLFAKSTSPAIRDAYDRQLRATPPLTCKADIANCRTFDLAGQLASVSCPTLVVVGDEEYWHEGSDALHAGIKGAKRALIPAAGHAIALEQPRAVLAAVEPFLAQLPR